MELQQFSQHSNLASWATTGLQGFCQKWFFQPLQAFNRLLGSQNSLAKFLQSFCTICSSRDGFVEPLLFNIYKPSTGSNIHRHLTGIPVVKTRMTILYRLSTSALVVKTDLGKIYRHSTGVAVVETGLSNIYRPSTGLAVLHTGLSNLYRASTGFPGVKMGLQQFHILSAWFPAVKTDLPKL